MSVSDFFEKLFISASETTLLVWIAILTALVYVILAAIENCWCWLFGIISSAIYIEYNFELKLYNDAWLSLYYCLVGIYGWVVWIRGKAGNNNNNNNGAILHYIQLKTTLISILIGIIGTLLFGKLTSMFTTSPVPYFDAALTSFSLIATWLTARKVLENWIFWIVIDGAYVVLYWIRNGPMTSLLFLIYTILAIYGYIKWRKKLIQ